MKLKFNCVLQNDLFRRARSAEGRQNKINNARELIITWDELIGQKLKPKWQSFLR